MQIQMVPIDQIIPYAHNPRKISEVAVAAVAGSIREFGFRQPIVVDKDMTVIVGHTRLMAARKLGMREVPVHIADGLTPEQVKAYRLADNKVSEFSEWDDDMLQIELSGCEIDLNFAGFDVSIPDVDFEPATEGEQGKLDQLEPKLVKCPQCGHVHDARETSVL